MLSFLFFCFLLISLFIVLMNYGIFYNNFKNNGTVSWIPLFGGFLLSICIYYFTEFSFITSLFIGITVDLGCLFGFVYNFILFKKINNLIYNLNYFLRYKNNKRLREVKKYISELSDKQKEEIVFSSINEQNPSIDNQSIIQTSNKIESFFLNFKSVNIYNIYLSLELMNNNNDKELINIGYYKKYRIILDKNKGKVVDEQFFCFYEDKSVNFYDYLLTEILYYKK